MSRKTRGWCVSAIVTGSLTVSLAVSSSSSSGMGLRTFTAFISGDKFMLLDMFEDVEFSDCGEDEGSGFESLNGI